MTTREEFKRQNQGSSGAFRAPGPKGVPILGNLIEFNRDVLGFSTKCARDYGDVVSIRLGPALMYMFNHPSLIEEVLQKQSEYFIKDISYRALRGIFGNGLVFSEGNYWKRHRRMMQPAFHKERIVTYSNAIATYTDQLLDTWQDGETCDIHQEMMQLTLQITAKTLFGADVEQEAQSIGDALDILMVYYLYQMQTLFLIPEWLPTPTNRRTHRAVDQLNEIVYGIINKRRHSPTDDMVSMLLQVADEDGNPLTDRELRDEVMTLLLAGYETTANTLSWTLMLLSQNPEVETKLVQELQSTLDGRTPSFADLAQLHYTKMVIQESMRLYPVAWGLSREVAKECKIGNYCLRPGTLVYVSQWVMHRDSRFFENPEQFQPERWANNLEQRLPPCTYFPFGSGPRICIGKAFAMMESVLILAMIIQKFQLTLVPDHPIELVPSITLCPKQGIQMVLNQR